jgi:aspartate aminotransferase-like enzyme
MNQASTNQASTNPVSKNHTSSPLELTIQEVPKDGSTKPVSRNQTFTEQDFKTILMTPGPVPLHPQVLKSLCEPMIHHRTPAFDLILKETLDLLKKVFQTQNPCFILSSTGSGGMEALLVNVLTPQARVLSINSGKFGQRWAEIAQVFGAQVSTFSVPWGEKLNLLTLETELKRNSFDIILTQACETSTGVLHPIKEMAQLVRQYQPQGLFLVDGITALGALPLPMDEWLLDGLVGGSQKAFMLPTGLSFLSFSQRAWDVIHRNPTPRFYFDVRQELKANQAGQTYFSSNVTLIRALHISLSFILEKGLPHHYETVNLIAQWTRRVSSSYLGLESFSQAPSPSITALKCPEHIDSQKLRDLLEERYHLVLMGGQDQLKGHILRLGHMGFFTKQNLIDSWIRLDQGLKDLGFHHKPQIPLKDLLEDFRRLPEFYESFQKKVV